MAFNTEICKGLSDREVVTKAKQTVDYFACLVVKYEKRLLAYICTISATQCSHAEDVLQDAFVKIWKNLHAYDASLKFENWIFRIVHNETINHIRKQHSHGKGESVPMDDTIQQIASNEDETYNVEEPLLELERALPKIKMEHREVLVLKFFENKSYEEISDILKIPEGTVATRINRAKKELKQWVKNPIHIS
ncbi:MAG: RNA polymerase sigma factor [Lewinellaceae bacterium]|nr:RNA polymerase sigma factor [Lewinellaceae bacterium]